MDQQINITITWDDAFLILKQLEYRLDDVRQIQKKFPDDSFFKERIEEIDKITESFSLASGIRRFV